MQLGRTICTWLVVWHNIALVFLWALGLGVTTLNACILLLKEGAELFPYRYTLAFLTAVHLFEAVDPLVFRLPPRFGYLASKVLITIPALAYWLYAAPREPRNYTSVLVQACDSLLGLLTAMRGADGVVPPSPSVGLVQAHRAISAVLVPVKAILGHCQVFWTRSLWIFDHQKRQLAQLGVGAYAVLSLTYSLVTLCTFCRDCKNCKNCRNCKKCKDCKNCETRKKTTSDTCKKDETSTASTDTQDSTNAPVSTKVSKKND